MTEPIRPPDSSDTVLVLAGRWSRHREVLLDHRAGWVLLAREQAGLVALAAGERPGMVAVAAGLRGGVPDLCAWLTCWAHHAQDRGLIDDTGHTQLLVLIERAAGGGS